jgi:glucan phosphoethanolaminetransferase (alkaline phosphatase superfamily)
MADAEAGSPDTPRVSQTAVSIGAACATMSVAGLLYAGDYIVFRLPMLQDLYKSVKVSMGRHIEFMYDYGLALWGVLLIGVVISCDQALRNSGHRRALIWNATILVCTLLLVFYAREAAWRPLMNLLRGLGTSPP